MNIFKQRLLNSAQALDDARPIFGWFDGFDMRDYGGLCGTPHCVLGHYAKRRDMQKDFRLGYTNGWLLSKDTGTRLQWHDLVITDHFGISHQESFNLFSGVGCNDARNRDEAIAFIRAFAEAKWPEPKPVPAIDPAFERFKSNLEISSTNRPRGIDRRKGLIGNCASSEGIDFGD